MDNPNPWVVENIEAFSFYCCPECDFQSKDKDHFKRHAMESHKKSKVFFLKTKAENNTNNDPMEVETKLELESGGEEIVKVSEISQKISSTEKMKFICKKMCKQSIYF